MAELSITPPQGEGAPSGASQWFYFKNKRRQGPVEAQELQDLFDNGSLPGNALVRPDQFRAEWRPASEVDFFETPEVVRPKSMPPPAPGSGGAVNGGTVNGGTVNGGTVQASAGAAVLDGTLNDSWERDEGFETDNWATGAQIRPWVRYFARWFDFTTAGLFVGFAAGLFLPPAVSESNILLGIVFLFAWSVVEAGLLSTWGWTPGKWLLNVRVRDRDGGKISFGKGLRRMGWVSVLGVGLGIHILALGTLIWSYFHLKEHGDAKWDRALAIDTEHREIPGWKVALFVVLGFGIPLFFVVSVVGLAIMAAMAEGAL
ncbi:MAG TPA: RDD family protein [Acidobacteriota bacterium]|nr:RDD family protein [Acidobacteriota bacterium]